MKRIASAADPIHAHLIVAMLEEHGIEAIVQGEALWGARGELPFTPESAPSIWVADEADAVRARDLIARHDRSAAPATCAGCGYDLRGLDRPRCPECGRPFYMPGAWHCSDCGESVESNFTHCWNCGADQPGDKAPRAGATPAADRFAMDRDENAFRANPYCRRCGGTGRESRVLLPGFLLLLATVCWLAAVEELVVRRFPNLELTNLPMAIFSAALGVVLVVVAYHCRQRQCSCVQEGAGDDSRV